MPPTPNPDDHALPPIHRKSLIRLALIPGRDLGKIDTRALFEHLQAVRAAHRRRYLAEQAAARRKKPR